MFVRFRPGTMVRTVMGIVTIAPPGRIGNPASWCFAVGGRTFPTGTHFLAMIDFIPDSAVSG